MRRETTGLICCLLLGFFLTACGGEAPEAQVTQTKPEPGAAAAVVNGQVIPQSEIDDQIEKLVSKFREASPKLQFADDKRQQMAQNFLERAIRDTLLLQEADRRSLTVEDAEIETRIEQLKKMFGGTPEGEQRFMAGIQDMDEFRVKIAEQIRISKLMEAAVQEVPEPDEAAIQAYYEANTDRFAQPEQIHARHILARFGDSPADRAAATPTREQRESALRLIQQAMSRVDAGEDFATVAREMSQDTVSAAKGGDLDRFGRGRMVKEFEDVAFALPPGQVSDVVETQFGYHIIKVEERTEAGQIPLEEARERIVRGIQQEGRKQQQDRFVAELRANATIEIK